MEFTKLLVLFFVVVFPSRNDAVVTYSTVPYPDPDYNNRTVIILPEMENATVTFGCAAYQDGGLRETFWYVQPFGTSEPQSILNFPQFVRSGRVFQNLTIVNVTTDLDRGQVWCGPSRARREPRFLLGFEGE